jgi:uncharacterized protein (TIGR03435 family)
MNGMKESWMGKRERKHASRWVEAAFACLALLMATASSLSGQETPVAESGNASDSAGPVERDYRFEVASVRPADPPNGHLTGPLETYSPGRYREDNAVSLAILTWKAFGVKQNFEIENPRWMDSTYFTVNATLPEGATKADVPIMIEHLLEERFGLVFHHEARQLAGYELVTAKPGSRLTRSPASALDRPKIPGPGLEFKNGMPQFSKDAGSGQLLTRAGALWRGRNKTMKSLAEDLARELGAPVMDGTGLEGEYDYDLTFTPEPRPLRGSEVVVSPGGGVPVGASPSDDTPLEHPLLRDALREQLGLELRQAKNVPVDVVVIDSAKKVPTEN